VVSQGVYISTKPL